MYKVCLVVQSGDVNDQVVKPTRKQSNTCKHEQGFLEEKKNCTMYKLIMHQITSRQKQPVVLLYVAIFFDCPLPRIVFKV